jgi:membrane-bound lytic murein transglycosylase D
MPSASLLARASTATTDVEKTAEAIVADVLTETSAVTDERAAARIYRVRPGDTLYAIARRTGTTVNQLKLWNKLSGSNLRVGARLLIQSPRAANTQ